MKKAVGNILTNVISTRNYIQMFQKSISEQNLHFANETSCCSVRRRTLHTVMSDQ